MSEESSSQQLQKAVDDWRVKHNIAEDDPLWVSVELWKSFLESATAPDSAIKYQEVRRELEELDRLGRTFAKQSRELVKEIRAVPKIRQELTLFPYFAVLVIAAMAFVTGVLVEKLFLR